MLSRLEQYRPKGSEDQIPDGWHTSSIDIRLPFEGAKSQSVDTAPTFRIEGVRHRKLVDAIKSTFKSPRFLKSHLAPHKRFFDPKSHQKRKPLVSVPLSDFVLPGAERVYKELYEGDT